MNVVDLLITIVVVTILVTIVLAIATYVAYKLRLSREPVRKEDDPNELRYFTRYDPPGAEEHPDALETLDRDIAGMGARATEA